MRFAPPSPAKRKAPPASVPARRRDRRDRPVLRRRARGPFRPQPGGGDPDPPGDPGPLPLPARRGPAARLRADRDHAGPDRRRVQASTRSSVGRRSGSTYQGLPRHRLPRRGRAADHRGAPPPLGIAPSADTDSPTASSPSMTVACLGCCSLAPVMMIDEQTVGRLTPRRAPARRSNVPRGEAGDVSAPRRRSRSASVSAPAGLPAGAEPCQEADRGGGGRGRRAASSSAVGCNGMCHREPLVEIVDRTAASARSTATSSPSRRADRARHLRPRRWPARVRWTAVPRLVEATTGALPADGPRLRPTPVPISASSSGSCSRTAAGSTR